MPFGFRQQYYWFCLICLDLCLVWPLKTLNDKKWYIVAVLSWGMLYSNIYFRCRQTESDYSNVIASVKILQEVISLTVFIPFSI